MVNFLRHSNAEILQSLLVQLGAGSDPSLSLSDPWPIYESAEPDVPDEVITIFGEKGKTYGRNQLTGETIEKPGVQFRIRSSDSSSAFAKASEIAARLDQEVLNTVVTVIDTKDGLSYIYVVENINRSHGSAINCGNVVPLGKSSPATPGITAPSSARSVFTINALVSIRNQ